MFTILIVRMVSQVCTYINTYQIVYLEYLLFIVRQLHLNKAVQMVGFFLAESRGMRDLSSLTRDGIRSPCSGSAES